MKLTKIPAAAAAVLLALLGFASTASATTLEIKGVKQAGAVTIDASLEKGTSFLETTTANEFVNTCTESTFKSTTTTPFTATRVGGPISVLTFAGCTEGPFSVILSSKTSPGPQTRQCFGRTSRSQHRPSSER